MQTLHRTALLIASITGCASSETSNNGPCNVPATHATIADAIADDSCARINLEAGTYSETLVLDRDVTIAGVASQQVVIDGGQRGSVVTVASGHVELSGLTIRNGLAEQGGGIANHGALTLRHVFVDNNAAVGAVAKGGGIYSDHLLIIEDSEIANNRAAAETGANGAGIYTDDLLIIRNSLVAANAITASGVAPEAIGGGIYASSMTAHACVIANNTIELASNKRDFRALGAGVYLGGTVDSAITNTRVTGNRLTFQTNDDDGGLGGGAGLAIENGRIVTIDASTVAANELVAGGTDIAGVGAGLLWRPGGAGELDIRRTTIADNNIHASFPRGAGIAAVLGTGGNVLAVEQSTVSTNHGIGTDNGLGGGIHVEASNTTGHNLVALRNSTVSGNALIGPVAHSGGGVHISGLADNGIELELASSTITNNRAPNGIAGLALNGIVSTFVRNTILTQNVGLGDCATGAARFSSEGFNLFGDVKACLITPNIGDIVDGDAKLAPLAENGGFTRTHAAQPGSPAIDHGDPAGCGNGIIRFVEDQCGAPRVKNGRCDIGAFEN